MTELAAADRTHTEPAQFDDIALPRVVDPASNRPWTLRPADPRDVATMVQRLGLEPQLARILSARGVTPDTAQSYLDPKLRDVLPDPYILKDMERAVERLAAAVLNGEAIGVFGDYDVDGTTAAAILFRYLENLGAAPAVYLPDRIAEGYGPSADAFRALMKGGANLIVTVDCGASANDPINAVAADGAEIIVLDHHLMNDAPPANAYATVNPNRLDDVSGQTNLSAAGVAYLTVVALNRRLRAGGFFKTRPEPNLMDLLDLAALGLVCDVMSITGLTRVIVSQGLKVLDAKANAGLAALGERAGAKGRPSTYHLGFLLGPRINAAGRIGHARLAFELMTTKDEARARALAEKLHSLNAERQAIEADVQLDALKTIEAENLDTDNIIVVAGAGWHPGVIGIVAGRIKEKYDRPAIVIGVDDGVGKGSGRSITGVDLGSAIAASNEDGLLINGGGHAMAAGLTVDERSIPALRARLNAALSSDVDKARENRTFVTDAVISAQAVSRTFADLVAQAGPFGVGNPEPVFVLADMRIAFVKRVGENHLSVTLEDRGGKTVRAIAFRAEGEPLGGVLRGAGRIHVAGKIRADDWRGGDAGQLQIEDAAPVV